MIARIFAEKSWPDELQISVPVMDALSIARVTIDVLPIDVLPIAGVTIDALPMDALQMDPLPIDLPQTFGICGHVPSPANTSPP